MQLDKLKFNMKIILYILLFTSLFCSAQTEKNSYGFQFYKNGRIVKAKKVNVYIVNGNDTLQCDVNNDNILVPKVSAVCSVLIEYKNKTYQIDDFDFSKISSEGFVFLGIENNMENFDLITPKYPNAYILKTYGIAINIDNYVSIKKICFLNFSYTTREVGNKAYVTNYAKSTTL